MKSIVSPNSGWTDGINPMAGGASNWLPSSESGLRVWYRAGYGYWQDTAGTTAATADATAVARWDDQSGNGYNLTQSTSGKRPQLKTNIINGNPVLRFDGSDDCITNGTAISAIISASAYSYFALLRPTAAATNNSNTYQNTGIFCGTGQYWGLYLKSVPEVVNYNWDTNDDKIAVGITLSTAFVTHWRHESGNIYISKDGGSESSTASGNTSIAGSWCMGARDSTNLFMTGDICELFGYNVALGSTAIANANAYLKTLGGIA